MSKAEKEKLGTCILPAGEIPSLGPRYFSSCPLKGPETPVPVCGAQVSRATEETWVIVYVGVLTIQIRLFL